MSEPGYSRAIVLSDDAKRAMAFVAASFTPSGYRIPQDPKHPIPEDTWVECPRDGSITGPIKTTLAQLRGATKGGLPPVRLRWTSRRKLHAVTLTHWSDSAECGRCTTRELRQIAREGEAGFAGQLRWWSGTPFPDLSFVCSFVSPDSWLVGWHLLKGGVIRQGGAYQRPSRGHTRRYVGIAQRWCGLTPGGDALLDDFAVYHDSPVDL